MDDKKKFSKNENNKIKEESKKDDTIKNYNYLYIKNNNRDNKINIYIFIYMYIVKILIYLKRKIIMD